MCEDAGGVGDAQPQAQAQPGEWTIPWQNRGRYPSFLNAIIRTVKVVLLHPSQAFSNIRVEGSIGGALVYALILGCVCGAIGQVLSNMVEIPVRMALGQPPVRGGVGPLIWMVFGIFLIPFAVVIGTFLSAGVIHLCLLILGGARRGFEATYCVVAYAGGSTNVFAVVPFVGWIVALIWALVVEVMGLASAHQISRGKAALAVFLPIIVCCCVAVPLYFLLFAVLIKEGRIFH